MGFFLGLLGPVPAVTSVNVVRSFACHVFHMLVFAIQDT